MGQLARAAAISQANRARAERNAQTWTAREMAVAMETHPDYEEMVRRLPHRTLNQCKKFCSSYGIAAKRHVWTTHEVKLLKQLWEGGTPTREIVKRFGFSPTPHQIQGAARHYRLKRPEQEPALTGHPVIDAIRQECRRRHYTMVDLDEWCGSKTYWRKGRSYEGLPHWTHLTTALGILGGRLSVTFNHPE